MDVSQVPVVLCMWYVEATSAASENRSSYLRETKKASLHVDQDIEDENSWHFLVVPTGA